MNRLFRNALLEDLYLDIAEFLQEEEIEFNVDMHTFVSDRGKAIRAQLKDYLYSLTSYPTDRLAFRLESLENMDIGDH